MMPALATETVCCSITSCSCRQWAHGAVRKSRAVLCAVLTPQTCNAVHTPSYHAACTVAHLVKFINAANPLVRQHQCTTLQHHVSRLGVFAHIRCQTNSTAATAAGVNAAWGELVDIGEQLRLGHTRVTHQQDVDVTSSAAARDILRLCHRCRMENIYTHIVLSPYRRTLLTPPNN